jgi:hypothetical protein
MKWKWCDGCELVNDRTACADEPCGGIKAEANAKLDEMAKLLTKTSHQWKAKYDKLKAEKVDCGCNCGNCPCCWAREDKS